MAGRFASVPSKRAIVDRRALADRLASANRAEAARALKEALALGRAEIEGRLDEKPYQGTETAAAYAYLTDQIVRSAYDYVVGKL